MFFLIREKERKEVSAAGAVGGMFGSWRAGIAVKANVEANMAVDAILAQIAVKYGARVKDEETGEFIGFSVSVPVFSVDDTLRLYEVRTRKDEAAGEYIVGVMERRETA